jgi:uncharacterized protein YdhG (YjbR/CyaY superfamily)
MKERIVKPESAARTTARVPPKTIDDYINHAPRSSRATLDWLRAVIKRAAPMATETISHQIPAFRHKGLLIGFGATPKHSALYTFSQEATDIFEDDFWEYDMTPGTIRFPHDAPPPIDLVEKLVRGRIRMNDPDARSKAKKTRGPNKKPSQKKSKVAK